MFEVGDVIGPGFLSITVSDIRRSAAFYEQYLDAKRDPFDFTPAAIEPFDGPFGRQFIMRDPDGYKITIYEKDQPLFWPPST